MLWTLFTYRDYGATFDESGVYTRGITFLHSIAHGEWDRFSHRIAVDDDFVIYDHLYSMLLYLTNPDADITLYHWENLLFGLLAFVAAYLVLLWQTGKPWLSLLGPIFLFLTPRFLGDLPANPKDMPFAVLYFLALTGILYFHRQKDRNPYSEGLVLGILFGLALCTRLVGASLFIVYILFDPHFYYHGTKRHTGPKTFTYLKGLLLRLVIIGVTSNLLLLASWPYLRADYFGHLREFLFLSKNFHWNNPVLFAGQAIPASELPRTYLPVWLWITTPLFILFFIAGAWAFVRNKTHNGLLILMACAAAVNLGLYLLLHPTIYDGLRHFLFLLPILAVTAALSAASFWEARDLGKWKKAALAAVLLNMGVVACHIVLLHPYEYVYFNEFTGGLAGAQGRYETDYWGASLKEGVEWLGKNGFEDPKKDYKLASNGERWQVLFDAPANVSWTQDLKEADFYLSTTRADRHELADPFKVVHVVKREGVPLCYVFKMR